MGIACPSVELLCAAKSLGVDFSSTVTIGRQRFFPQTATLDRVLSTLKTSRTAKEFLEEPDRYAEKFFEFLGAQTVDSIDISNYEGATLTHDMNQQISPQLANRFTLVHEGGTIEHVFNISQALKNCMEMVKVGGHLTLENETNNFDGHGFWQISPEAIFRALSAENGYRIVVVLMREATLRGRWFVVSDPDSLGYRVELCNEVPTFMLTIAQRIADVPIFSTPPQQSDYQAMWKENRTDYVFSSASNKSWKQWIPLPIRQIVRPFMREFRHLGLDQPCYRQIATDDLLRGKLN